MRSCDEGCIRGAAKRISGRRADLVAPCLKVLNQSASSVKQWLVFATENAIIIIDALALS